MHHPHHIIRSGHIIPILEDHSQTNEQKGTTFYKSNESETTQWRFKHLDLFYDLRDKIRNYPAQKNHWKVKPEILFSCSEPYMKKQKHWI